MSCGSLDVTLVSASISPYTSFESEPCDTYAILKCAQEKHSTKKAEDHGRLPVWNETFTFDIQEQDMTSELLVQVFNVKSDADELLGIGRLSIFDMVAKDEATLCPLINPLQGEIGKLKAVWKWKPGSQAFKATGYGSGSGPVAHPHGSDSHTKTSGPYGKLEAVSDALGKLSMERGSGRYSSSYSEDSGSFRKEEKAQDGGYYSYPPAASGAQPVAHPLTSETCARGELDYSYPPPASEAYPPNREMHSPHVSSTYPPPLEAHPRDNQGYPPYSSSQYPPDNQGYPPYASSQYPPPQSGAYPPLAGKESYLQYPGSVNPPHPDPYSTPGMPSEGFAYMEKGGGDKERGGSGKEKGKGHGSHSPYGQPPPAGYPPSSYPAAPAGYPQYGHPPGGYPPAGQGYPPAPQGYPPAPHGYSQGYPPQSHGYPPQSHGYPPAGYPPQGYPPAHSAPGYPPQGYPPSGHGSGAHKPDKHGYAAGAYAGHSSSSSTPSKKHKEPKHSSSHKHNKHKKQKSFKGSNFKKFKMFKF